MIINDNLKYYNQPISYNKYSYNQQNNFSILQNNENPSYIVQPDESKKAFLGVIGISNNIVKQYDENKTSHKSITSSSEEINYDICPSDFDYDNWTILDLETKKYLLSDEYHKLKEQDSIELKNILETRTKINDFLKKNGINGKVTESQREDVPNCYNYNMYFVEVAGNNKNMVFMQFEDGSFSSIETNMNCDTFFSNISNCVDSWCKDLAGHIIEPPKLTPYEIKDRFAKWFGFNIEDYTDLTTFFK